MLVLPEQRSKPVKELRSPRVTGCSALHPVTYGFRSPPPHLQHAPIILSFRPWFQPVTLIVFTSPHPQPVVWEKSPHFGVEN